MVALETKMAQSKIRKCPFCGKRPSVGKGKRAKDGTWRWRPAVSCSRCHIIRYGDTVEEALQWWNGRLAASAARRNGTAAQKNFRDYVLEESKKGNVVFAVLDDYMVAPLDEFIAQPADGILYDLNRLPEVVLTFIDDRKWVYDYAVSMVIRRLREKLDLKAE